MKALKPLAVSASAALLAVLVMTMLPVLDSAVDRKPGGIAVFRSEPVRRLGNDTLVDALISIRFTERIKRAEWKSAALSVDFEVARTTIQPEGLLVDLNRLITLSFRQSENVDRLLVRFVRPVADPGAADTKTSEKLMLAADVRRGDKWLDAQPDGWTGREPLRDPVWRSRLRLSITDEWRHRFGAVQN